MAHPTEWWLQREENGNAHRTYQSIDNCNPEAQEEDENNEHAVENEAANTTNPLHDFLNNTILSYKRRDDSQDGSKCSEIRSSISDQSSLDSQVEPPHKTLSVLFFDLIRFMAINADCRLINTELMPMVWSGVGKTVRQSIRHGANVGGMSDEKMEVLHVALR